jgi:hypothetical protein
MPQATRAELLAAADTLPTWQYRVDDEYVRTATARMPTLRHPLRGIPRPKLVLGGIVLALVVAIYLAFGSWWEPLVLAALVGGFVWYVQRGTPLVIRSSPQYGVIVHCTLTPSGVHTWHPTAEGTTYWSFYSGARAFPDGIMLYPQGGGGVWLPDATLIQGSRAQAEEMLGTHLTEFENARARP